MNFIDILLAVPLLYGFYTGYSKGIISQLTGIIGGVLAILFGIKLSGYLKVILIENELVNPAWGSVVGFIATVIGIILTLKLAGYIVRKGARYIGLGLIEKLIGAVFGAFKWSLFAMVILFFFVKINAYLEVIPETTLEMSILYPYYQNGFQILYELANPIITQT